MSGTDSTGRLGDEASQALRRYAENVEKTFLKYEQSLTRPETAASFLLTLAIVERALQGHRAQGVIDDVQLGELLETINGLRKVPGLL